MAEPTQFTFTYKEVVALLVRHVGLTEGEWALQFHFGLQGINVGPSDDELVPGAIVGIGKVGLQKADKPTNISVNAKEAAKVLEKRARG